MAVTKPQLDAEKWILKKGLNDVLGGPFVSRKVKLNWGGMFNFDMVSKDGRTVGNISTSSARTASGKQATAKIQKIKCDTLYLLHASGVKKRVLVFTEIDMLRHFEKEVRNGRFPSGIKLLHVALPPTVQAAVETARRIASEETSPARASKR